MRLGAHGLLPSINYSARPRCGPPQAASRRMLCLPRLVWRGMRNTCLKQSQRDACHATRRHRRPARYLFAALMRGRMQCLHTASISRGRDASCSLSGPRLRCKRVGGFQGSAVGLCGRHRHAALTRPLVRCGLSTVLGRISVEPCSRAERGLATVWASVSVNCRRLHGSLVGRYGSTIRRGCSTLLWCYITAPQRCSGGHCHENTAPLT